MINNFELHVMSKKVYNFYKTVAIINQNSETRYCNLGNKILKIIIDIIRPKRFLSGYPYPYVIIPVIFKLKLVFIN
jgi:hypothetical protein